MKLRLPILVVALLLLALPILVANVGSSSSAGTLYAHAETTTLPGGNIYYTLKLSSADGPTTTISQSAASIGRKEMGKWVYPLSGIASIAASTWTVTYRAMRSSSASSVIAHGDIDILILKNDNTIRATIATNVANSPSITLVNVWETLTGTYNWPGYTVVDQTDYLEVIYYIDVTQKQSSKQVRLLFDDGTLPLADQTKIQNVIFTYPNQNPVASFTFSPSWPATNETVSFDASSSYDPDGSIVSYTWDFGDGNVTTVTTQIITHIFTIAASVVNYTVTLTVTDNEGAQGFTSQIVPVTNPTVLHVSLPAGTYAGPNSDNWLSQCWLLNITETSGTFTIRINNTHDSWTSYDTHLIIALNEAAHNYLTSLTVNGTSISSFVNSTPEPYGYTLTWEEDVYSTWFNDTYVVGAISPKDYKDVTVSVSFSNATGVRIHFDSYGSRENPPPPPGKGLVTHNPHEKDSTVLFSAPPVVKYYLTVQTDPSGITTIPGTGWYDENTVVVLDAPDYVYVSANTRYRFNYWDVNGTSQGIGVDPITIYMDAHYVATAHYILQYSVVFNQTGLTPDATGTVVTVDGAAKTLGDLPFTKWVDKDGSVSYSYNPIVSSSVSGKQFRLDSVTGPLSSITVTGPATVIGNYIAQYQVTFAHTGLDPDATGTVVTVDSTPVSYSQLPYIIWVDEGDSVTYSYNSIVSSSVSGKRFRLDSVTGPPSPIIVGWRETVTGNYVTQYQVTFAQTGLGSDTVGTVVTVDSTPVSYVELPYEIWVDANTYVTYSYTSIVTSTDSGKRFRLDSVTGPPSPIYVTEPTTVTGNYVTQYLLSFRQTGLDSSAVGTVVTVNLNAKQYSDLPYDDWFDKDSTVIYSYNDIVLSDLGKRFKLIDVTGPTSPITVTTSATITGNYKTQYQVTFAQTGVGTDFTGTVVTIDGTPYTRNNLPQDFWWDKNSMHDFAFASPLVVDATKQYVWSSTSGLSNLQSETLTITTSGSVIGNYIVANTVTFDQVGIQGGQGADFLGPVVTIDGTPYDVGDLPVSFPWILGSEHTFEFHSPLVVNAGKQYVWTHTTGLSNLQSGSITVTTYGSIVGHYKTQYYLTLATNPSGVTSPSGAGWYDANTYASISTDAYVDIVAGSSRYRFNGWTTADMSEIVNPALPSTTVKMDKAKTVTANYIVQYFLTVSSPYGSSPYGSPTPPPPGEWFDNGTSITASVTSPWPGPTGTRYVCTGWTGTGSVPPHGSATTVTFTINEPSSITWNWKTQHYLTVLVRPSGITTIPGEGWYDDSISAPLTAPYVAGYKFLYWDVDGVNQGSGVTSITVPMNVPHTATANYEEITAPVGGYSVSLATPAEITPLICYTMILALFSAVLALIRRKRK